MAVPPLHPLPDTRSDLVRALGDAVDALNTLTLKLKVRNTHTMPSVHVVVCVANHE